jgi:hypothetical protein
MAAEGAPSITNLNSLITIHKVFYNLPMKQLTSSLILLLLTVAPSYAGNDDRAKELQKEREKLHRETDPVDRAKISIKISDLLLEDIADAVKAGNISEMQEQLTAYSTTIEGAHQTLVESGRNAQKKSGGFKELEIALRKQTRKFDDYARMPTIDRREPIEAAKKLAAGVRDKLLKALFP